MSPPCLSIEGRAGHTLWQMDRHGTVADLIRLLRTRFGTEGQTERYRIELKGRRRRKNETLQSLYNDICRLISLSYPGQTGSLCDIVARDCFLQALDPELRMKIMERDPEPATVEEALRIACRLEAVRRTADDDRVEEAKHREKNIRAVEVKAPASNETIGKSEQKVKELESTVEEYRKELDRMKLVTQQLQQRVAEAEKAGKFPAGLNNTGAFGHVPGNYAQPPQTGGQYAYQDAYQQQNYYNANHERDYNRPARPQQGRRPWSGWRNGGLPSRDVCRRCGLEGHWARDCTQMPTQPAGTPVDGTGVQANGLVAEKRGHESYQSIHW